MDLTLEKLHWIGWDCDGVHTNILRRFLLLLLRHRKLWIFQENDWRLFGALTQTTMEQFQDLKTAERRKQGERKRHNWTLAIEQLMEIERSSLWNRMAETDASVRFELKCLHDDRAIRLSDARRQNVEKQQLSRFLSLSLSFVLASRSFANDRKQSLRNCRVISMYFKRMQSTKTSTDLSERAKIGIKFEMHFRSSQFFE